MDLGTYDSRRRGSRNGRRNGCLNAGLPSLDWRAACGTVRDMASSGLSVAEAARRLEETGPNEVRQRGRISVWSSIGVQLRDPLIVVLLAACALTLRPAT